MSRDEAITLLVLVARGIKPAPVELRKRVVSYLHDNGLGYLTKAPQGTA